mmetsp:Transcript_1103/g.1274  ORF Transcript_1103/g.1274 Transcript_1103/m.1274 type:complete len:144 (-) Transcript_1103:297-728(-)
MMKLITRKEVPTIVSILLFVASVCMGTTSSSDSIVTVNAAEAEIMTNLRAKTNNINHHNHLDSYSSVLFNSRLGLIRRRLEEEEEEEDCMEVEVAVDVPVPTTASSLSTVGVAVAVGVVHPVDIVDPAALLMVLVPIVRTPSW